MPILYFLHFFPNCFKIGWIWSIIKMVREWCYENKLPHNINLAFNIFRRGSLLKLHTLPSTISIDRCIHKTPFWVLRAAVSSCSLCFNLCLQIFLSRGIWFLERILSVTTFNLCLFSYICAWACTHTYFLRHDHW